MNDSNKTLSIDQNSKVKSCRLIRGLELAI